MDKSLASALVKAADHAFHPYGNSCGVLVYTGPGQSTVSDCREWAKNSGVATQVVNTRDISTEADISSIVPEADRVVLIFDNFDRARSAAQGAVISYMDTASSRCMVIAIANSEVVSAVADKFNYKVTIGDRGRELHEAINLESDLLMKLNPLSEVEIFEFMKNLRGGTYFNMGMYSSIPVSRAYKSTIRIYKVIDLTAIVSGVSYENVGTTKEFRDRTGEGPGKSWYDHTPGFENKVGQKKSDPNSKYVLWDIKRGTGTCVRYYVVDIDTGVVTPVSKADVENSPYLTASEKAKLTPKPVEGFDKTTGELVENKTNWRTAAFDHIFWLSQAGKATQEYGTRFEEAFDLDEATSSDLFMDAHAHVRTDLDAILSGEVVESMEKPLDEAADTDIFMDAHTGVRTKLDDVLSGKVAESRKVNESISGDIVGFIDCSGSNYPINLDLQEKIANDFGATTLYYFSNRVYNTAEEAGEGGSTIYKEICAFAKANTDKNILVITDSDVDYDYRGYTGGDELKTIPNVKIERIEDHLQESVSATSTGLKESYRRTVSRGSSLADNELFVDFD